MVPLLIERSQTSRLGRSLALPEGNHSDSVVDLFKTVLLSWLPDVLKGCEL
jgi:hypothetical protein